MQLIPTKKQWDKWSLPSKYSLVGLIIGIVSLLPVAWGLAALDATPGRPDDPLTPAVAAVRNELISNTRCIDSHRMQMQHDRPWPPCELSTAATDDLFENNFYALGAATFGEDDTLLQYWAMARQSIDSFNNSRDVEDLARADQLAPFSLKDLYHFEAFLLWYLGPLMEDYLGRAFRPDRDTPEQVTGIDSADWQPLTFRELAPAAGVADQSFLNWLSLMD